jgi:hypothetical protein
LRGRTVQFSYLAEMVKYGKMMCKYNSMDYMMLVSSVSLVIKGVLKHSKIQMR